MAIKPLNEMTLDELRHRLTMERIAVAIRNGERDREAERQDMIREIKRLSPEAQ